MSIRDDASKRYRGLAVAAAASVALGWLLSGCVADFVGPAPNLYNLTPKSSYASDLPEVSQQLVVEEPVAAGGLDSHRIALRPKPTEVKYFADARWTERAPRMVQTLLVESFENTGKIVSVGRQAIGLRSDFNLKTELREFQAEYSAGTQVPTIRVRINAKLIQQPRQMIVASRSFEQTVTAKGTNMSAIIAAFDEALGKVLKSLVEWTLRSIEEVRSATAMHLYHRVTLLSRPANSFGCQLDRVFKWSITGCAGEDMFTKTRRDPCRLARSIPAAHGLGTQVCLLHQAFPYGAGRGGNWNSYLVV